MMDIEQVRTLTGYGVFLTSVSVTLFSILYGFRSAWRSTMLGWTFLAMMSSFALFMDTRLVFRILRGENETLVYWLLFIETYLVAITTTTLTVHLFLIQRRGRKEYYGIERRSRPPD